MGKTVVDQAANLAYSHPQPIDRPPNHSDLLTHLRQSFNRHWTNRLTVDFRQLTVLRYRYSLAQHWRNYFPSRPLDTAITRLRIGYTRLNAHLHRLNMVQDRHCPWCPTQPDTPEHLLHSPRFLSLRNNLIASLTRLHTHRLTLEYLLGSDSLSIPSP